MGNRNDLPVVEIYTDGSCALSGIRKNHGGYCAILVFGDNEKVVVGHSFPDTNSTMELKALIYGLRELKKPCRINFYSDAQYLVRGCNEWLDNWIERKWKSRNGEVAHRDLWEEINHYRNIHKLTGVWIRGHSPIKGRSEHQEYNVRCDELAEIEAWKSYKEVTGKEQRE